MQVSALSLLEARQHLNLVHLEHFFPAVRFAGHASHVAPVRVDHLAQVLRVNWNLKLVAFGKEAVRFNQITRVDALCVTILQPVE